MHETSRTASAAAVLATVLLTLSGCGAAAPSPAARPTRSPAPSSASSTTTSSPAAELCDLVVDVTLAYHASVTAATRGHDAQVAAQRRWHDALRALTPRAAQPAASTAAATLVRAATVTAAEPDPAQRAALASLDAFGQAECGHGVSSFRPARFGGVRLPRWHAPPSFAVVSDGRRVEAVDSATGRSLGTIATAVGQGGVYDVALGTAGDTAYFLEEFGAFASPSASGIWAVRLAGGDFELLALERGLIDWFDVSPDGKLLAYTYTAARGGDGVPSRHLVVVGPDGEEARAAGRSRAVWLADSRRLAVPATRGGVHGVEVIAAADLPAGRPATFHPASQGGAWVPEPVTARLSDGALVVTEHCCVRPDGSMADGTSRQVQVYVDDRGRVLGQVDYGPDRFVVDFDASGRHPLVVGDTGAECDHACTSTLYRVVGARLVPVRAGVVSAAWS